jgi:sialate O-acetylesterase
MRFGRALLSGLGAVALLAAAGAARAEVRLPAVFGDNMVLQRDAPIAVWGWAEPAEAVTVEWLPAAGAEGLKSRAQTTADKDGRWSAQLPARPAGGPVTLAVKSKNTIELKNVLLGDVWICSGQSNMYWPVRDSADAAAEIAAANYPAIRLFFVWKAAHDEPQEDLYGRWEVCSPQTAGGFSAAAYFFARKLYQELKVPVGLIHASWAASPAEPWVSRAGFSVAPELQALMERRLQDTAADYEKLRREFDPQLARWQSACQAARKEGQPEPARPDISFRELVRNRPAALWNGMIAPLVRAPVKGVIWYQGEGNVGRAGQYRKLFPALITDWRRQWKREDLPFFFVQLAPYEERQADPVDSQLARLREAQTAALTLPKTAMACTIDIGDAKDIHPKNKQDVGLRLALAALHVAYGRELVYSGPVFKKVSVEGGKAVLTFDHVGGGLVAKGADALQGFAVAGPDKKFVWAAARIAGDTVVVTSDGVKDVVAVRYAWADNPQCNLFNKAGLPAVPFRTDDW